MIRALLLLPVAFCVVLAARLAVAEVHYARGMAARSVQGSLDGLTVAGEAYPWSFTFRTAQAKQLFVLAAQVPTFAKTAAESLSRAVAVDPRSVELVSMLLAVQRGLGRCEAAETTASRLLRLAPRSERVKSLRALPCKG